MAGSKKHISRRDVLKQLSLGVFGAGLCIDSMSKAAIHSAFLTGPAAFTMQKKNPNLLWTPMEDTSDVSLIKGNDRRDITYQALKKIEDKVIASLEGKKKILLKPNMVTTNVPLCATGVDALRGILDFLKPHFKGQVTIGESTASRAGSFDGFKNYGYLDLEKEYGVKFVDLNKTSCVKSYVFGQDNQPLPIRIIDTFYDPDLYIISAAKLKTHDRVVTTLSLKNVLLASPMNDYRKNDKGITHTQSKFQKNSVLHYNLFHLAQKIWPDLAVIDGFEGMEGEGPVGGTKVDSRIVIASLDPLAADKVATKVMGFDPEDIMYMRAMTQAGMGQGDFAKINILGDSIEKCRMKFRISKKLVEAYGNG